MLVQRVIDAEARDPYAFYKPQSLTVSKPRLRVVDGGLAVAKG